LGRNAEISAAIRSAIITYPFNASPRGNEPTVISGGHEVTIADRGQRHDRKVQAYDWVVNLISILCHVLQTEIQILGGAESDESAVDGDHKSNEEYSSHAWKAALGVDKFHESGDYKVGNGHEPGCSHDNTGHLVALKNKRKTKQMTPPPKTPIICRSLSITGGMRVIPWISALSP
jgi:hypothetical protein